MRQNSSRNRKNVGSRKSVGRILRESENGGERPFITQPPDVSSPLTASASAALCRGSASVALCPMKPQTRLITNLNGQGKDKKTAVFHRKTGF